MITGAFRQFKGVGPKSIERLRSNGIFSWDDLCSGQSVAMSKQIPETLRQQIARFRSAIATDDIGLLLREFHPSDHWRILADYWDKASFFDIETDGFPPYGQVTVIACLHRGGILTFVRDDNLDDFLDLLDEVELLVSFNGATFDVPILRSHFHIPDIPCPHLDLRWPAYHHNLRGGQKEIEKNLGLDRPSDLQGMFGDEAILLWHRYIQRKDDQALKTLLRYCAADVLGLAFIAAHIIEAQSQRKVGCFPADPWRYLIS